MNLRNLFTLLLISFSAISYSQEVKLTDTSVTRKDAINLFIDCNNCDIIYFKEEMTFVNYVRDRKESDVHIIITEMRTGSGGTEYTLSFYGENKFDGQDDTLVFSLPPKSTNEEERSAQLNVIKLGLVSYVAKTPLSKKITVVYEEDGEGANKEVVEDKWKSWVAEANVSGYMSGEEIYSDYNLWSNIGVSKVTPDMKLEINYRNNYSESIYRFDWDTLVSITRSNYGSFLYAKSMGEHWSLGGVASINSSSYRNLDVSYTIAPAVEYNLFKYSDATTKQLRFLYRVGYEYNDYNDTTIFNKTEEGLAFQRLAISFKYVQKWGSLESSIQWKNYLSDFSKYNIGVSMGGSVRLIKGLSLRLWGGVYQQRDQITLRKGNSSTEDILLKQNEMASQYSFWTNFGLSYTFGSIYNNVVNPRFD